MPTFIVVGHRVITDGSFSLNDLPGSTGRLDILLRCVNASFFLSHGLRRNVETYLVLLGEPDPPKTIRFVGDELKYLNPDERSTASLIRTALMQKLPVGDGRENGRKLPVGDGRENGRKPDGREEVMSTPGIYVSRSGLPEILQKYEGKNMFLLAEDGENIHEKDVTDDSVFVLGGQLDLTEEEMEIVMKMNPKIVSLGPKKLHASHCITVVLNNLDNI